MGDPRNWSEAKLDGYCRAAGVHLPPLSNLRLTTPQETNAQHEARILCPYCRRTRPLALSAIPTPLQRLRWLMVLGRLRCARCGARPSEAAFYSRVEPITRMGVVLTFDPRG